MSLGCFDVVPVGCLVLFGIGEEVLMFFEEAFFVFFPGGVVVSVGVVFDEDVGGNDEGVVLGCSEGEV